MGVIKKKTGTRGTEGGIKYVCDVCSSDITSTVCSASSPRIPQHHGTDIIHRFAYDVPRTLAMSTTSVYHASPMAKPRVTTSPPHIPSKSSSNTRYQYIPKTGAPMKSWRFSKAQRPTALDHGPTSQITLEAIVNETRSATTTSTPTSRAPNFPSLSTAVKTTQP